MALAIALGHEPPHHDDPPEGPDSFLADHGFEYIDGERTRRRPEMASASEENDEDNGGADADADDDVQGLSRVVDALSTIMWPTMVHERDNNNNAGGGKGKSALRPSLFDFDDAALLAAEGAQDADEEETLAALMAADAADQGAPQTRASRMQREMAALERWLVENEELHEAEVGRAGVDDGDGDDDAEEDDEDEDRGHGGSDSGAAPLPSASAAPEKHAPLDDPWAAPITPKPTSTPAPSTAAAPAPHSISITAPPSGFDDDFSAFVSAPPAVSIAGDAKTTTTTTASTATPASATASASASASTPEPISDARHLHTQTAFLLPSHTGGSIRSLRSAASEMSISDTGDDLSGGGGYEALDDRSSLNFSPEHEDDVDLEATDLRASMGGGDQAAGLGDVPFDLPNILSALQTIREDVAGIEDEAERRATTARFASEFVFKRMGVDGDETEETEG